MADANAIADMVIDHATFALRPLERTIANWPAEFRSIMWQAVVLEAQSRQKAAEADKQNGK